eukprot:1315835-Pyramimonas_sp.AAC.1
MEETHANCAMGTLGGGPMGPRSAVLGGGDAWELLHWDLRVPFQGPRCAGLGGGNACELRHWGI